MRSQAYSQLVVAATSLVSALTLCAQSTRFIDPDVTITSLTQDHRPRRATSALGSIEADTGAAIDPSVLQAPVTDDSAASNGGAGAKHARSTTSTSSMPLPSGTSSLSSLTVPLGASSPSSLVPSAKGPELRAGMADSSQPSTSLAGSPASSGLPSSQTSSREKPTRGKAYSLTEARSMPIPGGRSLSNNTYSGLNLPASGPTIPYADLALPNSGWTLPRSAESRGAVTSPDLTGVAASGIGTTSASDDSNSLTDQPALTSDQAPQGFFEVLSDPFGSPFENHFEDPRGQQGFARSCGDACGFGKAGPSTQPNDFKTTGSDFTAMDSDEADNGADRDNPDSGSRLMRSRRAGSTQGGRRAALTREFRKRSESLDAQHGLLK